MPLLWALEGDCRQVAEMVPFRPKSGAVPSYQPAVGAIGYPKMPQTPLKRRIQRARKRGKSVAAIAAKEGVSERTVQRAISSKEFQQQLAVKLVVTAERRLNNSDKADRIAEKALTQLLEDMNDPKVKKKPKLTMKDIADLGKFSHLQHEQGVEYLKESIKRGQEQMDEQLKKDSQILEASGATQEEPA